MPAAITPPLPQPAKRWSNFAGVRPVQVERPADSTITTVTISTPDWRHGYSN
ncbi:hypothetical protein ABH944_004343 [Caballeronia udeis]|uniref:Uncharacterized protein n=1 Tax=Caballeronia udeis TaxID=1232866 RepID=A0ABW8MK40_9BURK